MECETFTDQMTKPFRQLDLNLLRLLVALQGTGSVTRAGQALALSQPAASNALARLRAHFDDPLFVRTPSGLGATPVGAQLAQSAARHLESLEREVSLPQAFDAATSDRTWQLSLSDLGEMVFLPAIAAAVLSAAPRTRIVNAAVSTQQLAEAMAAREVDLAIGIIDARQRGMRSEPLFSESYVALSDPARVPRQRTAASMRRWGLVVASPTATFHGGVTSSLKRAGLLEHAVVHTRHFAAIPDLVRAAPLVGIVPESWARKLCAATDLIAWPVPAALPAYSVQLVWHAISERDPALAWLRAQLRQLFLR